VPSGRRGWLGRRGRTCTRWTAARRGRPGPGPGAAPTRSPRRSPGAAPPPCRPVVSRLAPCLSFCLIHPRPGPFTDVHPDRVCAVRGRWRTPVNAGQHCWKACWGQPLASSNLLSSATSDQAIHQAGHGPLRLRSLICSLIHSTHIGIKRPKTQAHASGCCRGCGRPLDIPAPSRPARCRGRHDG
jgi:hypothetical protein